MFLAFVLLFLLSVIAIFASMTLRETTTVKSIQLYFYCSHRNPVIITRPEVDH